MNSIKIESDNGITTVFVNGIKVNSMNGVIFNHQRGKPPILDISLNVGVIESTLFEIDKNKHEV